MCPSSTADPGNAEANSVDAAGAGAEAEAIKVSYCRRSEGCAATLGSVSVL